MHRMFQGVLLIGVMILLNGCGGGDHDLHEIIDEVRQRPGKPIEPVPDYKPIKKFAYPIQPNRRNPFYSRTAMLEQSNKKKKNVGAPDMKRPKQPLEAFPLDGLTMVGILKQGGTIWGLVVSPNGVVHKVTVGTYMGKHYGRVTRVSDNFIRLTETVLDDGKWKKKKVKMELETNTIRDKKALPK
jgi:type IV pilus assembly protein PilP